MHGFLIDTPACSLLSYSNLMKDRFIPVLFVVGIITTAYILVFDWEYNLLHAEMGLIDTLLLSSPDDPSGLVRQGSVTAYLAQMGFWTALLIFLGILWSSFLFPKRPAVEKVIFSLPFGLLVMPLAFVLPAFIISAGKILGELTGAGLPVYYEPILVKIVNLISNNQEQGYEVAAVMGFFILGLVIAAAARVLHKPKRSAA